MKHVVVGKVEVGDAGFVEKSKDLDTQQSEVLEQQARTDAEPSYFNGSKCGAVVVSGVFPTNRDQVDGTVGLDKNRPLQS